MFVDDSSGTNESTLDEIVSCQPQGWIQMERIHGTPVRSILGSGVQIVVMPAESGFKSRAQMRETTSAKIQFIGPRSNFFKV